MIKRIIQYLIHTGCLLEGKTNLSPWSRICNWLSSPISWAFRSSSWWSCTTLYPSTGKRTKKSERRDLYSRIRKRTRGRLRISLRLAVFFSRHYRRKSWQERLGYPKRSPRHLCVIANPRIIDRRPLVKQTLSPRLHRRLPVTPMPRLRRPPRLHTLNCPRGRGCLASSWLASSCFWCRLIVPPISKFIAIGSPLRTVFHLRWHIQGSNYRSLTFHLYSR